jgi:hypothetical protein
MSSQPTPLTPGSRALGALARQQAANRRAKWVPLAAFALLVVLVASGWWWVHPKLLAISAISMRGGEANWDWSAQKWRHGGETSVAFPTRIQITDADLEALPNLQHVVSLNLYGCVQISDDGLAVLARMPHLEFLDLSRPVDQNYFNAKQKTLTDKLLEHVKGLKNLRELHLAGATITDDGLKKLAGLQNLSVIDLTGTAVTKQGLRHLKGFRRLTILMLDSPEIKEEDVAELLQANPTLEIKHPMFLDKSTK